MKINKLILHNFKGQKDFIFDPQGDSASIYGDNATFKTTLYDAFLWLLFGKDSQNKSDFEIKPLDVSGNTVHHLNTEVEGNFNLSDKIVTLKKAYYEKWTKRRGSANQEFSGHSTDYFINGVPKPKKDFDSFITGIVDESIFKLLTNPAYFNTQLDWKKRREILLEICGDITDNEVIASDKKLAKLPDILEGRSLEDHKEIIKARQTAINKILKEIPSRIDEATRGLPDITGVNCREVIQTEVDSLKSQQKAKQQELVRVESGGEIAEKQRKIRETEGKLLDIQTKHRAATSDKAFAKKHELQELQLRTAQIDSRIANCNRSIESNLKIIDSLNNANVGYRADWETVSNQEFELSQETVCPSCGQGLPEDQLLAVREKAQADFNLRRAERIKSIKAIGLANNVKIAELNAENEGLQKEIENHNTGKSLITEEAAALQIVINSMTDTASPSIEGNTEYKQAVQEKVLLEQQIAALNNQQQSVVSRIKGDISAISLDISARERSLAQLFQAEQGNKRITELESQEKSLAAEYEGLQGQVYLVEEFTRTKVNLLESKINSKFKYARFKLFETQINGGLNETCVTTLNGKPYDGALNSGHKIIVGLDIITTLSKHYGFSAPIFIDNAESVTELPQVDAQIIRLVVNKPDKILRVEVEA